MNQCPWHSFAPSRGLFDVCEQEICHWVAQPGNTWTNIGFLVTAYLIFKATKGKREFIDRVFIFMSAGLFIGSTAFHMTVTRVGQVMDLAAIYFLSAALITFGLKRLYSLNKDGTFWLYMTLLVVPLAHMILADTSGIRVLAALFTVSLIIEFILWKKAITKNVKPFIQALLIFLLGFSLWVLDIRGILCDPNNHILSAHGVWHILCAIAVYQLYYFFKSELKSEA